jgi:spore maturation protein CgeB
MPMAANTDRLDKVTGTGVLPAPSQNTGYRCDISFVGSLYNEEHNFFDRMTTLSDYTKGYLDAIMNAQMKVQGYNFIQESLSPIMEDLYKALPMDPNSDGVESREYLYAQYVINRKITGMERMRLLQTITKEHSFDLFTRNKDFTMPNLENHGPADYYREMPLIFRFSKINLNISLRSIKSGIPLRAFDIMGSGGFLLSNYQADFLDDFVPGEDFDYYESEEDLLQKIDYYLTHEKEREEIAQNGHDKVAAHHTFRHRVREMLAEL